MSTKARLFVSFVAALTLLWVAVPKLPMYGTTLELTYSLVWLSFCLLVIGANLHSLFRLGRGEVVERPAFNKEQKEAIKRVQRYKPRRVPSR
jgi:integral membrane sensor domain MASE1